MTRSTPHPGQVLAKELEVIGITPTELARQLQVPANRITQIIQGKRAVTGDSALRLAHWFGGPPEFWMSLQARYDLLVAEHDAGAEISALPKRGKRRRAHRREPAHAAPERA